MYLYQLDNSHQIFNNALQYFIDKISNPTFLQFVLEQTQKPYGFNQDWTEVTVPRLIQNIMNNDHALKMIEIIHFILKYSAFNLELILKNITTSLQLQEKKQLQKIQNIHPLIYLIIQILDVFEPNLEEVTEVVQEILTALRHFLRDLIRQHVSSTHITPVGDFIISFSTQLPSLVDQYYCATQLITIFVNEIANTIAFLYKTKIVQQDKIRLLDLLINLQNSSSLYKINFYFNFYKIEEKSIGVCQLCQSKDQKIISLCETEGDTQLIEVCLDCFTEERQISDHFEEKIYLPALIYGQACTKKDNWMKLSFTNYTINKFSQQENPKKQSKKNKPTRIHLVSEFLNQLYNDYARLNENIHQYLWYFAYMSFLFSKLFQTYRQIQLLLLAFFDDNSVTVRAKILNCMQDYCLKIKKLETPNNYLFPIFDTSFAIQKIKQRPQDIAKSIRANAITTIITLLGNEVIELNSEHLEIVIKRLSDIEPQVRKATVKSCLDFVDIFRKLPQQDKILFFDEISRRLEEKGEIADLTSQLIMLLLVTDNQNRDRQIADRLLELTLNSNDIIKDYDRIQNLINKLSDDNKIIDKANLLHNLLQRLFFFSNKVYNGDKSKIAETENALRLISIIINEKNPSAQRIAQKQIDNIMEITTYFLDMEDEHKNHFAIILNGCFKLLIFCIEEFQSKTYENRMPFQISTKLKNQFDYLIIFIEKILFGIHPKSAYLRSVFTLSVLLDLKYTPNGHKNIFTKLETVMKLILIKDNEDPWSLNFALIGFSQIFEYFEFFIQKSGVDVRAFVVEDLLYLYDSLLYSSKETANEEIIFTMAKMWEKIPQLMFESCDFLKENLKYNSFPEPIIIAIYQTFYQSILDANLQADKQQFNQRVDKSKLSFLIKDIFNVVFQQHILHENKQIRILVLKLIELLFDNQLSIALQFGDYLIQSLINEPEIAEPIIKKCLEGNAPNMLMQFKSGIKMIMQHKTQKPYFTNLNTLLKNVNKQTLICKSPFYDVCSSKLCECLKDLDNAFFLNKIDGKNYLEDVQFLLYQFMHLQYLSKNEIKAIIKQILYRVDDFLGKIERKLQELNVEKDFSLAKVISLKVFCAYQLAIEPEKIFGENIQTLRQFHQMREKIKGKKPKDTVKEQQCYEITHKNINKFFQYINSSEINLEKSQINIDLSDSDYEKKKPKNIGEVQQFKFELDLIEKILDFELGKVDDMLKLFDEIGVFDKVQKKVEKKEIQEEDQNEEQKQQEAVTKKLKNKTTKRKPRK